MANKPENLKPFKKGNDPRRNTTGLNKGSSWLKVKLIKALSRRAEGKNNKNDDLLIEKMLTMAIKEGNEQIIKLIWEYLETKPTEYHDLVSNGEPIFLPVDLIKKNGTSSGAKRNS